MRLLPERHIQMPSTVNFVMEVRGKLCHIEIAIFTVFVFNMLHCDEKFNMPGNVHSLYFLQATYL